MSVVQFPLTEEYKKDTGIRPEDVASLREWLKKQPHLPGDHITDLDIILAYHSCDRSSEGAKRLLDLHFTLKTIFTGLFENRLYDDNIDRTLKTILLKPLNARSREGYACLFTYVIDKNVKNFVVADVARAFLMVVDLWQQAEGTWPGLMLVFDMASLRLSHLSCFDYTSLQQLFYFLQEVLLLKLKGIHFVNAPPFMDKVMALINSVGNYQDLFIIHSNGYKDLDKYYPLEELPSDVGGSYKTLNECRDINIQWLKANNDYFVRESLKRVMESRRPGKPKTVTDFFGGVEGSFKKLDID